MLKISIVDTPTEHRIVLIGKLVGPWIRELQKVWDQAQPQLGNRRCVVNMNDVTLIDGNADGLLLTMSKQGAELVANNMQNRWLIKALKNGKPRVSVRTLRPNNLGFSCNVDAVSRVTTIAEGTVTMPEVRAHLQRERRDLTRPYSELIDARRATVSLSSTEVREIAELLRSLARSHRLGRTAVVVSSDAAYGVVRMLQVLVEDICDVRPFLDLPAAERWLRD